MLKLKMYTLNLLQNKPSLLSISHMHDAFFIILSFLYFQITQ